MTWLFILITGLSFAEDPPPERKDELIVKVINSASDDHHIKDILDIIKPSRHYRYIPSLNTLNTKHVRRISSGYGMLP